MMDEDRGFIAPHDRTERMRVERTALLGGIDVELARTGIVMLCAPWGYGRTTLLGDYTRIARRRCPTRPVVRVEFDTFEVQSFLNGAPGPLLRLLARRTRRATGDEEPRMHRMPAGYANEVVQMLYQHLATYAPQWCSEFERGLRREEALFEGLPLLVIDDLPRLSDRAAEQLAEALSSWAKAGVRIVATCTPSAQIPRSLLPEAPVVTSSMLSVSPLEMRLWMRELCIPDRPGIAEATRGVPALLDACRSADCANLAFDDGFLRVSGRVMEYCLGELVRSTVDRARWAMVMLQTGTLGDLALVGVALEEGELAALVDSYPLFGLDLLKGTFSCIPVSCERGSAAMLRAACGDEHLTERCVELLVSRGCCTRASEIAALMSDAGKLRLMGRYPDVFADAANGSILERAARSLALGAAGRGGANRGLARLARLHALGTDVPDHMLPETVVAATAGTAEGALHAARTVMGFWRSSGTVAEAVAAPPAGSVFDAWSETAEQGAQQQAQGIEAAVHALGAAGLQGDGEAFREQLGRFCGLVNFAQGGLAAAIYAFHACACGFMCDQAEMVLSWVEPLAHAAQDPSARPGSMSTVSSALLGAACAMARFLVERPSAGKVTGQALESIRAARSFFEERGIAPGVAVTALYEAACLLLGGDERRASGLLSQCQARWNTQGTHLGQLAVNLGLCVVRLAEDSVNQAAVHARMAESLAQRLGVRRALWLARLLETVTVVRNGADADLDRRLLEGTLRRTALHPASDSCLDLELALLYAARLDAPQARNILHGVGAFSRPVACRILVTAVRALRKDKSRVLDLLPRGLRAEYESLRPSSSFKLYAGMGAFPSDGLLSLPQPGCGITVNLFGGLRVSINGYVVSDQQWGRRKARKLLAVLALYHDAPVSRDLLIETLWPGRPATATARNNLNTLLSSLRAALGQRAGSGPEYLISRGNSLGLNPELVDVDVLRFERLARTVLSGGASAEPAELLEACSAVEQLFKMGFGSEFSKEDGYRACARANDLTSLFVDCMMLACTCALEREDPQLAVWYIRAAERIVPEREDVRRLLAEALTALEVQTSAFEAEDGVYETGFDGLGEGEPAFCAEDEPVLLPCPV